mgnify:CR=1 FL=1
MITINDKWIDFAIRLQSIAQAGLQYGKDKYDKERYEEIRSIAAEMISVKTDIPVEMTCFAMKQGIKHLRLIREQQYSLTERFFLFTKIMAHGLCREVGVMLTSRWLLIRRRKLEKSQD